MSGIEFFNHFDTGAAVFGNLVNIATFHQAHTNIRVPETIDSTVGATLLSIQTGIMAYEAKDCGALKDTFRTDKPYWLSEPFSGNIQGARILWFSDGSISANTIGHTRYVRFAKIVDRLTL